jgi:hypothetical protein
VIEAISSQSLNEALRPWADPTPENLPTLINVRRDLKMYDSPTLMLCAQVALSAEDVGASLLAMGATMLVLGLTTGAAGAHPSVAGQRMESFLRATKIAELSEEEKSVFSRAHQIIDGMSDDVLQTLWELMQKAAPTLSTLRVMYALQVFMAVGFLAGRDLSKVGAQA